MTKTPEKLDVTASQLARLHGVSRTTIYAWLAKGLPRCGSGLFRVEQTIAWRAWHTGADGRVHRVGRVLPELSISNEQLAADLARLQESE